MREAAPDNSQDDHDDLPIILAMGGSTRAQSTSEAALRIAAEGARSAGTRVEVLGGRDLMLPIYDPDAQTRDPAARRLLDLVRVADGIIVVSPGYHGGLSGMVKNALDYLEDLRDDQGRGAYLHGRAVGCIAVAHGWQAAVGTLHQLRQVAHALRGWPTPFGAVINSSEIRLDDPSILQAGSAGAAVIEQLQLVGRQVAEFAFMRRAQFPPIGPA